MFPTCCSVNLSNHDSQISDAQQILCPISVYASGTEVHEVTHTSVQTALSAKLQNLKNKIQKQESFKIEGLFFSIVHETLLIL